MGIQSYKIPNQAMTTNSQLRLTTPAAAGRLYLKAAGVLDGAWCAKNETKVCYSSSRPVVFYEKVYACNSIKKETLGSSVFL